MRSGQTIKSFATIFSLRLHLIFQSTCCQKIQAFCLPTALAERLNGLLLRARFLRPAVVHLCSASRDWRPIALHFSKIPTCLREPMPSRARFRLSSSGGRVEEFRPGADYLVVRIADGVFVLAGVFESLEDVTDSLQPRPPFVIGADNRPRAFGCVCESEPGRVWPRYKRPTCRWRPGPYRLVSSA